MIERTVSFINGKGGVGKTSLTANLGGLIAAAGYRVLLCDLDRQGNLARDLGIKNDPRNDLGRSMFVAATTGAPLAPVENVRPNLDVIPGGKVIGEMAGALYSRAIRGESVDTAVEQALAPLAGNYDLILLDCPPGEETVQRMALTTSEYVVIPTKSDAASLDGLVEVSELFAAVRQSSNPYVQLLGVVLFGTGVTSKRIAADTRKAVARDLGNPDLVFDARIRHVEAAAVNTRDVGRLVHEVEADLPAAKAARLAQLRAGRHRADDAGPRLAASAAGLAADYAALAQEFTARLAERVEVAP
jgi:cellulose biosynthesis protein BcsQ